MSLKYFFSKSYQQVELEEKNGEIGEEGKIAKKGSEHVPEDSASLLSKLFFHWAQPLISIGYKRTVTVDDLEEFPSVVHCGDSDRDFQNILNQEREKRKNKPEVKAKETKEEKERLVTSEEGEFKERSFIDTLKWARRSELMSTYLRFGKFVIITGFLCKLVTSVASISSPIILKKLLEFLSLVNTENAQPHVYGYLLAIALFVSSFIQSLSLQHLYWLGFKYGSCYRQALMAAIYRKLLALSPAAKKQASSGQMMNMVAVDSQRVHDFIWNPHDWWASPLVIISCIYFLWYLLGFPAIIGAFAFFIMSGLNLFVTKVSVKAQEEMLMAVDARIGKISEILLGVKFLKLYSWESVFRDRANEVREKELGYLKKLTVLRAFTMFFWAVSPAVVSLIIYSTFSLMGGVLTPPLAFTILSITNALREPMAKFFQCIYEMSKFLISTKRIEDFLNLEEVVLPTVVSDSKVAVRMQGNFSWETDLPPVLENFKLEIPKGKLYILVGPVGSGKSSVMGSITGEVKCVDGTVEVAGRTISTMQTAWMMNATLRENITFGKPFAQEKYDQIIKRCALNKDIDTFPGGDQTEIGERGVNLSGGQKQRVALARAMYQDADIYLFDEPLGAVDSTVANWIFHECMVSHLAGKTRMLITHQLQFLPYADCILVMEDGKIKHQGTYEELMSSGVELSEIVRNHTEKLERIRSSSLLMSQEGNKNKQESEIPEQLVEDKTESPIVEPKITNVVEIEESKKKEQAKGKLIQEEEEIGPITRALYTKYFKSSGRHISFLFGAVIYCVLSQAIKVGNDYWLVYWTGNYIQPDPGVKFYLGIYAGWFFVSSAAVILRELVIGYITLSCSRNIHANLLNCMLRAPMSFFDSTPIGRIINRFSKDQSCIDERLIEIFSDIVTCGLIVLSTVVLICVLYPILIIPMIGIVIMYYFVQKYYRKTARELKQLEAISKSPIFSYFSESSNGATTVRAYSMQTHFIKEFMARCDHNQLCFYWHFSANRWLGVRMEFVSALIILSTALFSVAASHLGALETGLAGLALSYTLTLTANLSWLVRQYTELELMMTSVARVLQYTEVAPEAPMHIEDKKPAESWPEKADIQLEKVFVRYAAGQDFVLKNISCHIQSAEKIGIVGRTGAGKSSLTATLFRLVEVASGSIRMDKLDVSEMGLRDLRTQLSIIPQDPFIFQGTLRFNLDPLARFTDFQIWEALKKVNLSAAVYALPQQLDTVLRENGDNFSLGQKQLLSLCRVLLHKTKILVLDEATASLDLETDEIIQRTVRSEFKDSTVLTIAHRLDTIIDSDRVMVLDKGELKEMDSPQVLLGNPNSIFSSLVSSALEATKR